MPYSALSTTIRDNRPAGPYGKVGDYLAEHLNLETDVSIVSAYFSIYAHERLASELAGIRRLYLSLRFYRLHFKDKEDLGMVAYLNSPLVVFFQETFGNKTLGLGALDFFMAYFLAMPIPILPIRSVDIPQGLLTRQIGSIFTELGFDRAQLIRSQTPNPLPDRAALDALIFDALGLAAEECQEVYWAVAELVQQCLNKAASR